MSQRKSSKQISNCHSTCRGNCDNNCGCNNNCSDSCKCNCGCDYIECGSKAGGDLNGTYPNPGVKGIRGIEVSKMFPQIGQGLFFDGQYYTPSFGGSTTPTGPAGGDLGGMYPNPTVVKLQGYPVAAGSPGTPGQVLTWNGGTWLPQLPNVLSGAAGGDLSGTYPNTARRN